MITTPWIGLREAESSAPLDIDTFPSAIATNRLYMADPEHFGISYSINPHMCDENGMLRIIDPKLAKRQWVALREVFETLGLKVHIIPPLLGYPDLVFCANQCLPINSDILDGAPHIVPSNMRSAARAGEVPHVTAYLKALGYQIEAVYPADLYFEGMGDGLWHPGRRLLWAGIGPRSHRKSWEKIGQQFQLSIVGLNLVDDDFYHLDTCFSLLDPHTCLWTSLAFSSATQKFIRRTFPRCIEADSKEARLGFACNAFSPDGQHVILQRGCTITANLVRKAGFSIVEVDTSEFIKAGGSVFCMKLFH